MRRLGMAVAAILLCATVGFARENRNNVSKEPFAINFEKLSYYLQLTPSQTGEVANINEFFLDKQRESLRASESQQQKKDASGCLWKSELMKKVLTPRSVSQICNIVECDK